MKRPVVIQHDETDCGVACLAMICRYFGIKMPLVKYRELLNYGEIGTSVYDIVTAAQKLNLQAKPLKGAYEGFQKSVFQRRINLPCIVLTRNDYMFHYVVVYKANQKHIKYADPKDGMHTVSVSEFGELYCNAVVAFEKGKDFVPISIDSFTPYLKNIIGKCHGLIIALIIHSFFVILLSLLATLFIQLVFSMSLETTHIRETHVHSLNSDLALGRIVLFLSENPTLLVLALIGIYGIRLLLELVKSFGVSDMACRIETSISVEFYNKLISIPLNVFKTKKSGEYISRYFDVQKLSRLFSDIISNTVTNIVGIIGFGFSLYFISPILFACTLIYSMIFCLFSMLLQDKIRTLGLRTLQKSTQTISVVEESVKGAELVKTFGMHRERIRTFENTLLQYINSLRLFNNFCFAHNNVVKCVNSLGNMTIILIGIKLLGSGMLEPSDLVAYCVLLSGFTQSISGIVYLFPRASEAATEFDRLQDIMESSDDVNYETGKIVNNINAVALDNVSYQFGKDNKILDNVSLKILKGEKILIQGNNGCGKTTLANVIAGNYTDYQGVITYNEVEGVSIKSIKNSITYLNQEVFLFHDTIYNNLILGKKDISEAEFNKVCLLTGVNDFVSLFPGQYDYVLSDNGYNLSGGQRQKLALARALLRNSDIYILDESMSHQDVSAQKQFDYIIENVLTDKTVIVISHDVSRKSYINKTYLLEKGRLILC